MIASQPHSRTKQFLLLFVAAFLLRTATFFLCIQPEIRYQQPDSMDYHNCALCLWWGTGMHRADTHEPIFWRTPGYPLFLLPFYWVFPSAKSGFEHWSMAHTAALLTQIILSSLLPIFVFLLAFLVTHSNWIATIAGWITALHPGFILASTYLLTEGIATVFFVIFLYFFYKQLRTHHSSWLGIVLTAIALSIYTWMRPMGQFVAVVCTIIWLLWGTGSLRQRMLRSLLFMLLFSLSLAPWYLRNYVLTSCWFFCPMAGPYLNSFNAPKILRATKGISLEQAINLLYQRAEKQAHLERNRYQDQYRIPRELVAGNVAWPIIKAHPWLFIKDWMREVLKTTFDLYAYQLAAIAANTFRYDPLEEFLSEKLSACLYTQTMPWWMRIVAWLELVYAIALWFGIIIGTYVFMVKPISYKILGINTDTKNRTLTTLWWHLLPLIIAVVGMTGGFGYARLRLPVEPLMIILSLSWWQYQIRIKS